MSEPRKTHRVLKADLTVEAVRKWLDYDPLTGILTWRVAPLWWVGIGSRADTSDGRLGYRRISFLGTQYNAHILVWFHVHGRWPIGEIDHKNNDPSDNRLENLREATRAQNLYNRRSSTPGLKGTTLRKGKWRSQIFFNKRNIILGAYDTQEEAHEAYRIAAEYFHGDFANTRSFSGPVPPPPEHEQEGLTPFLIALRDTIDYNRNHRKPIPLLSRSTVLPDDLREQLLSMHYRWHEKENN